MTRTIDCRNLECPKPVIMTKNALEGLNEGESLEIIVNALAPKENISRFLKNQNIAFDLVPLAGVEPARYRYRRILSPLRLPIPSQRHKMLSVFNY